MIRLQLHIGTVNGAGKIIDMSMLSRNYGTYSARYIHQPECHPQESDWIKPISLSDNNSAYRRMKKMARASANAASWMIIENIHVPVSDADLPRQMFSNALATILRKDGRSKVESRESSKAKAPKSFITIIPILDRRVSGRIDHQTSGRDSVDELNYSLHHQEACRGTRGHRAA
jgi:hypothetical protein